MKEPGGRNRIWFMSGVVISCVLVPLGIISDIDEADATVLELVLDAIETLLMVTGACGIGLMLDQMRADRLERRELTQSLAKARSEGEQWRNRVAHQVNGIGAEIERQFERWGLTPAESEIGLLMLKGLSHKEIAALRNTSDSTGRQQARSIYQKSRLPNKAAFCAFFLEDLLPPVAMPDQSSVALSTEAKPPSSDAAQSPALTTAQPR